MPKLIDLLKDPKKNEEQKLCEMECENNLNPNEFEPEIGNTALHIAALQDYNKIIFYLLNKGAEIDKVNNEIAQENVLHIAVARGNVELVKLLCSQAWHGDTEYHFAKDEYVNTLLDKRMRLGEFRMTPLHLAISTTTETPEAKEKYKKIVELLLENGANPEIRDSFHNTALHLAIRYKKNELIELLLQYNADVIAVTLEKKIAIDICDKALAAYPLLVAKNNEALAIHAKRVYPESNVAIEFFGSYVKHPKRTKLNHQEAPQTTTEDQKNLQNFFAFK